MVDVCPDDADALSPDRARPPKRRFDTKRHIDILLYHPGFFGVYVPKPTNHPSNCAHSTNSKSAQFFMC